jgi:hypothetical protein
VVDDESVGQNIVEQRKQQRTRAGLIVDITYPGGVLEGLKTRNISLGGVFVEAAGDPPPVGEQVEIRFRLQSQNAVRPLQARVVRSHDDGFALLFRNFALDDFEYLQKLAAS